MVGLPEGDTEQFALYCGQRSGLAGPTEPADVAATVVPPSPGHRRRPRVTPHITGPARTVVQVICVFGGPEH